MKQHSSHRLAADGNPLSKNKCLFCSYVTGAATSVSEGERGPKPGDIVICFNCGGFLMFNSALGYDACPEAVLLELGEENLKKAILAHKSIRARYLLALERASKN
jgi:hypothetical protein